MPDQPFGDAGRGRSLDDPEVTKWARDPRVEPAVPGPEPESGGDVAAADDTSPGVDPDVLPQSATASVDDVGGDADPAAADPADADPADADPAEAGADAGPGPASTEEGADAEPADDDGAEGAAAAPAAAGPPSLRQVGRDLLRPSRAQTLLGILLCLGALVTVWTVRAQSVNDIYTTMNRSELVQMLDQLNSNAASLRTQVAETQKTKEELQTGVNSDKVAVEQSRKRLQQLQILAGTAPAAGPGVTITINDPRRKVEASMLLDGVEEMRDAGAEVIEINGRRIVASSWFGTENDRRIIIDQHVIDPPYVMKVIGDPQTLDEGARFRGGLVSSVQTEEVKAVVTIVREQRLVITALHQGTPPQYAKPTER